MTMDTTEEDVEGKPSRKSSRFAIVAKWFRMSITSLLMLAMVLLVVAAAVPLIRGTWSVNPVLSGSMRPGFSVGGVVISERVPVKQLAVRDVIVFRRPDKPSEEVVHRIVAIVKSSSGQLQFTTQGDANSVRDPWTVTIASTYAYRVRWSLPLLGYVAVAFANHRGVILLVVGLIVLIAAATTFMETRRRHKTHAPEEE